MPTGNLINDIALVGWKSREFALITSLQSFETNVSENTLKIIP